MTNQQLGYYYFTAEEEAQLPPQMEFWGAIIKSGIVIVVAVGVLGATAIIMQLLRATKKK